MLDVKEFVLANGFRFLAVDLPGRYAAMAELFVKMGSKYETAGEAGICHFMEHMAFKGTTKRPVAADLIKELDGMGVDYNAGTSFESTSYHIRCLPEQLAWSLEFLSDIVLNSKFEESELKKERGVILEEIAMYRDTPSSIISSDFFSKYIKSGLGCWNIIGNEASLNAMDQKSLLGYREKYFDPRRCLCVVVGDFKKIGNLSSLFEILAKNWEEVKTSKTELPVLETSFVKFDEKVGKDLDQAHFCIGWPGLPRQSEERYAARLLELLLCGNFSSRLVSLLREELGVAYYVNSFGESMSEFGVAGVQAGVKKERAEEILERSKLELCNLASWITPEAVKRTKDYLVGMTQLSMDRVSFWSEFIGQQALLEGKYLNIDEEIEKYKSLSFEEVVEFAKMSLKYDNLASLVFSAKN